MEIILDESGCCVGCRHHYTNFYDYDWVAGDDCPVCNHKQTTELSEKEKTENKILKEEIENLEEEIFEDGEFIAELNTMILKMQVMIYEHVHKIKS